MKININAIDFDGLEDDPLPIREKFKHRPKKQKADPKVNEKKDLEKEDSDVLLRQ